MAGPAFEEFWRLVGGAIADEHEVEQVGGAGEMIERVEQEGEELGFVARGHPDGNGTIGDRRQGASRDEACEE